MLMTAPDPFEALFNLQRALDDRRRSEWLRGSTSGRGAYPPINVFRKGDDYVAIVELPGIDKSSLDIEVKDNVIRLTGAKAADYPEDVSAHRRERVFGNFDRTISLPVQVETDAVKAEYRDGILALHLPRAKEDKPTKVKIK